MATIEETVKIVFGAEDNTGPVLANLIDDFDDFDRGITRLADRVAPFVKGLLATEAAIVGVGVALAGFAVNEAQKFQASFNEITTLFEATPDAVGDFEARIVDFARSSTQSIESINSAIYTAISAGIAYEDSVEFVSRAERLAVAGKADLVDTTKVLVSILNAYGESTAAAGEYTDTLFQIVKYGQTTLPELSQSLSQVTGIASSAGIPFTELGAAIAALTASGAPTAQAITGIRAAINAIIQPTKEASDLAASLGIEFSASALKTKGLQGVLQDVFKATNGNIDSFGQLFGSVEGLNAAMILGTDASGKLAGALESMEREAGAADAAFAKMSENFNLQMQRVSNNVSILGKQIGDTLIAEFKDLPGIIANMLGAIGNTDAFRPFMDALHGFAVDAQRTLSAIVANLPEALGNLDFTPLITALGRLGGVFEEVFVNIIGDVDLTSVDGLTAALQTAINIMAGFVDITSGIIDQFQPIFQLIGSLGNELAGATDGAAVAIGKILGALTLVSDFGTQLAAFIIIINETGSNMVGVFEIVAGGIKFFANSAQIAFDAFVRGIVYLAEITNKALSSITFGDTSAWFAARAADMKLLGDAVEDNLVRNSLEAREGLDRIVNGFVTLRDQSGESLGAAKGAYAKLSDSAAQAANAVGDVTTEVANQGIGLNELDDAVAKYGDAFKVVDGKIVPTLENTTKAIDKTTAAVGATAGASEEWVRSVNNGVVTYEQLGKSAPQAIDKVTKQTEKAVTETDKLKVQLEEIASKERIATIEARVKLNIAELETQTEQVKATFDSLNTAISSTGDVINTSLGALTNVSGFYGLEKFDVITKQLDAENRRRDEALSLQSKLTQAQVDLLRARTDSLSRGDAVIQIDGAGLQPHLEAFMFEILKAIQTRANEEGENFLLGLL